MLVVSSKLCQSDSSIIEIRPWQINEVTPKVLAKAIDAGIKLIKPKQFKYKFKLYF